MRQLFRIAGLLCLLLGFSIPFIHAQEAISSDQIVFAAMCETSETRLFVIDPDGQNLRQIGNADVLQPAWLRQGTAIGYLGFNGEFWNPQIYALATGENQYFGELLGFDALESGYKWSVAGSFIAYLTPDTANEDDGRAFLHVADSDGITVKSPTPALPGGFSWSPDGARIAYVGFDGQLHIFSVADEQDEVVSQETDFIDTPTWSSDGSQIAYFVSDLSSHSEIHILTLEDGTFTTLDLPTPEAGELTWSPDGTQFALVGYGDSPDVFTRALDGEAWLQLTDTFDLEASLSWSPDSTRVVFSTLGEVSTLVVAQADGSEMARLAESLYVDTPQWSPLPPDAEVSDPAAALPAEPIQLTCE
jgi:Tol biopolymer transport system component